jgi:SHS2 domain-containing protein
MRITHRIAGPQDRAGRGYRQALHPTDVRIEARGPTREECIAEAVRGLVDSFAVVAGRPPHTWAERHVRARCDEDLLVAVIDEVIYWINADGELPVSAVVQPASDGGAVVFLAFVRAADAKIIGAVPKAASARDLRCAQDPDGQWACAVTLEV